MKNFIRKAFTILILFVSLFMIYTRVEAITIKDYRNDLAALKKEKAEIESNSVAIKAQIASAKAELERIKATVKSVIAEMAATEKEITRLEQEIEKKEEEIKDLVVFLQVSNSQSFYLKYIFGAESFTDLIYRISVIEQLTTRNDELVEEMNNLIIENEKKIKQLEQKQKELDNLNAKTATQIAKLGNQQNEYTGLAIDIDTQISILEKKIQYYIDEGCSETQDLGKCLTSVPYDYGYIKPLKSAKVTDNFGWRSDPFGGPNKNWHKGIDLGGNPEGTPVYAVAAGKVVDILRKYYCGGNIITINHIVNGQYITTRYWHLLEVKVYEGEIVEQGQLIATVGGGYRTMSYDDCSTGAHLHFEMIKGHYYGTGPNSYANFSRYYSSAFDPRELIWFPAYGVWW